MVNDQPVNFRTQKLINIGSRDRDVPPLGTDTPESG